MATERQTKANQKNAQLSTGPRTAEGKSKAGSNALKHGLTAGQIVLPHEDPGIFEAFAAKMRDALAPVGALEEFLAERIVADAWRIGRAPALEAALHAREKQEAKIENLDWELLEFETLALLMREDAPPSSEAHKRANAKRRTAIRQMEEQPLFRATCVLEKYERELTNLARHEERLQSSMLKMLHELQRLQAERAGGVVPAPAVLDVNLDVRSEPGSIPKTVVLGDIEHLKENL